MPTAPPKEKDRRAFTGETVQCEAIPPDVFAAILQAAIDARLDLKAYAAVLAEETKIRRQLSRQLRPLRG